MPKKRNTVDVGIIDAGEHSSGDVTVAQVGIINEYGGPDNNPPERSFMRSTLHEQRRAIITMKKILLIKIQRGEIIVEKALALLGEFVADAIKQKIVDLKEPPNDPATIRAKGSSNPLIDTSQLKNSITYEVNR